MADLLSGRESTRFDNLPADNSDFLAPWGAEPYLGAPLSDNSLVFFDIDGTRRFEVPPVFLPGNEIQAQATNDNIEIYHVFVDAIGTNSTFYADTGVRYNPFLDTMYIDQNLEVGNNINAVGTITSTSDERVKEDIQTLLPLECLEKVNSLRPVKYKRSDLEGKPEQLGLIAQEVKELLPGLVHEDEEGKLSLSYTELIPILIGAVKELLWRVEDLEARCQQY